MIKREDLEKEWLDWVNNYLTIETFAEHRGLTVKEAEKLLEVALSCFGNEHPEK